MRGRTIIALPLTVLILLLLSGIALAQVGSGFDLSWHVVASGGGSGTMTGSNFSLNGTVSQTAIGPATGGTFTVQQGYWYGSGPITSRVFLPIVLKHVSP